MVTGPRSLVVEVSFFAPTGDVVPWTFALVRGPVEAAAFGAADGPCHLSHRYDAPAHDQRCYNDHAKPAPHEHTTRGPAAVTGTVRAHPHSGDVTASSEPSAFIQRT